MLPRDQMVKPTVHLLNKEGTLYAITFLACVELSCTRLSELAELSRSCLLKLAGPSYSREDYLAHTFTFRPCALSVYLNLELQSCLAGVSLFELLRNVC